MKVLVLNCGSSSIKHRVFEQPGDIELSHGEIAGLGPGEHGPALAKLCEQLGCEPELVAHRVVHGGPNFNAPALVDDAVLKELDAISQLAPLHNPANVMGIRLAQERFPKARHVAVFDTAFHATIPGFASRYAVPKRLAEEHGVRRYGFHGSSHAWASRRAAEMLGRPLEELRTVVLHLGAGASACAVLGGKSIDTSMGMTPLEGLVMATRCGDLDPAVVLYLQRELGMSVDEVDHLLHKESGLRGYCGDADLREVLRRAEEGNADAQLALDAYCYRIAKYVGAYTVALGELDAVVFTAGVGENSPRVRAAVCERLGVLGVKLDSSVNGKSSSDDWAIHAAESEVALLVVAANEELQIACEAACVVA